jgi:hypothetical protein
MSRGTRAVIASAEGGVVNRNPVGEAERCGRRIDNATGAGRIAAACGIGDRKKRLLKRGKRRGGACTGARGG